MSALALSVMSALKVLYKHTSHANYRLTADQVAEKANADLKGQIVLITGGRYAGDGYDMM